MQTMVFTGRLAADPQISTDFAKAVFRLLEKRGVDAGGKDRIVGVNCVSWAKGLNEKVIARGLARGCEALVAGAVVARPREERIRRDVPEQMVAADQQAAPGVVEDRVGG